ncbi:prephenate dehydratase [Enterococcus sp. AZ103]|uniref:prephenate dehydratase n=1 Tax=Enterococcus sp. AZ103 TaxID=2774628 RepID=UPI003F20662B
MKVAYLGPKGSFTYQAVKMYFSGQEIAFIAVETINELLEVKQQNQVDWAMVPVENTIEGSVLQTIDQIYRRLPQIKAEIILPIKQQFLVAKNNQKNWQNIQLICSHPQALAQSQKFITQFFPRIEIEQMASTTQGAKKVAEHPNQLLAAIASKEAAEEYDLAIVQKDIQSISNNQTRFWLLGDQASPTELKYFQQKATVLVDLALNQPGSLHEILAVFHQLNINLSKIESRPQKTKLGEYFFIIDIDVPTDQTVLKEALKALNQQNNRVTLLGNYPTYQL